MLKPACEGSRFKDPRAALLLSLAVCACASRGGIVERLDERSGLTLVTEQEPAAFARTESRISRSARDYLYLGPVEVNERGTRQYYLWVGIGSTIDRAYADDALVAPDLLYIDLDGAPVQFLLAPWAERVPRLAGLKVYNPAVTPIAVLAARVTLDQLERLSSSELASVRIARGGGVTDEYFLWRAGSPWAAFMRYAE